MKYLSCDKVTIDHVIPTLVIQCRNTMCKLYKEEIKTGFMITLLYKPGFHNIIEGYLVLIICTNYTSDTAIYRTESLSLYTSLVSSYGHLVSDQARRKFLWCSRRENIGRPLMEYYHWGYQLTKTVQNGGPQAICEILHIEYWIVCSIETYLIHICQMSKCSKCNGFCM